MSTFNIGTVGGDGQNILIRRVTDAAGSVSAVATAALGVQRLFGG